MASLFLKECFWGAPSTQEIWLWRCAFGMLVPLTVFSKRAPHFVFFLLGAVTLCTARKPLWKEVTRWAHAARAFQLSPYHISANFRRESLVLLVIWSLTSILWSLNPSASIILWLKLLSVVIGLIVLTLRAPQIAPHLSSSFWFMVVLGGVTLLMVELVEDNILRQWLPFKEKGLRAENVLGVEYINSGLTLSLIFWPALTEQILKKKYGFSLLFIILVGLILKHVDSDAARLGLLVGLVWMVITAFLKESVRTYLMPACIFLTVLGAPLLGSALSIPKVAQKVEQMFYSQRARLILWEYSCQLIRQKPLLGWGLAAATPASRKIARPDFEGPLPSIEKAPVFDSNRDPLDPHNAFLHIWIELGGIGALLWGLVMAGIPLVWSRYFSGMLVPAFQGFYACTLVILAVNCSVWRTWLLSAIGLSGIGMLCVAYRFKAFKRFKYHLKKKLIPPSNPRP